MQAVLAQDTWPTITGVVVTADDGDPIMGVSVLAVGTKESFITDINGNFVIKNLPASVKTLRVSCVGMETQTLVIAKLKIGKKNKIVLKTDKSLIDEVVVTGLYTRKKESFTGSSQTYKAEELKNVGNLNLIQSLKTLDPAFNVLESNEFGSDPNRLPDLEVRGKTSIVGLKETFGQDPNQPLFILDGFETTLQTIMDLSMDRIASVTILKDAASTAIYGSKAANGVIVVETKAPQMGKLKVSYSGNYNISFADLYRLQSYECCRETRIRAPLGLLHLKYCRPAGGAGETLQPTPAERASWREYILDVGASSHRLQPAPLCQR